MQKAIFYTLLLFFPFLLFSQNDTIVVQTFDWNSTTRSGDFVFPDESEGPFEKIVMMYNMRCRDAQVGNGNVGCREWDYSCNTFVTIPELRDSTFRKHDSYAISNFDDNSFAYSNTPVYSYYQFEQYETSYSSVITETTAQIGDGEAAASLNYGVPSAKTQLLFTAAELLAAGLNAGDVSGLRLDVGNANDRLNFLRLNLKHSNQEELNADQPTLTDFTEVYFQNTGMMNGTQSFNFHTPFNWDGASNLLLEMSYYHSPVEGTMTASATGTNFPSVLSSSMTQQALVFNGAGQINIPSDPLQTITSEITVSMWVNGDEASLPANTTIFEGMDANNARQANVHLPWSNNRVYWDCGGDGSGGYDRIEKDATTADTEGQWNHWAFTKNVTTGEMRIFLNGVLWHSGTGKTNPIDITDFAIASSITSNNKFFGKISEFRIFDKALDEATISEWMRKSVDNTHPDYANLVAYYPLNEGTGSQVQDHSSFAQAATISGSPNWQETRATDFFKDFVTSNIRPNVTLVQGEYEQSTEVVVVLDSVLNAQNEVISYEVDAYNNLIATETNFYWEGGGSYVYDQSGNIVDVIDAPIDGVIDITELSYFDKKDGKLELISLVTPYGNGLDLGNGGKTFTFDVSDFMPVLHGERFLSVEMGGQWQEDLDIQFLFIKGTPPHDVISIENVWPFARGWYDDIQNNNIFEPRMLDLDASGDMFKLRSSVTGHGQNGEFVARNHYLNIDGGNQEYVYQVWKACGSNPIYPQGGTWIFDRAGWCPGMATDIHEFDITSQVNAGASVLVDYGLNGGTLSEANYLVSNQLVTYGAPNFTTDAAIEEIMRPSKRVEYERINPACNLPQIRIKNTGSSTLTSLEISYQVQGGGTRSFSWSGNLDFLETEVIDLPLDDFHFWDTNQEDKIFEVTISQPNGTTDEYAHNNTLTSSFELAKVFDDPAMLLRTRTNNNGNENSYTIKDHSGNVVLSRSNMSNNTAYEDAILLPAGCYSLDFVDNGEDGLEFWFHPGAGTGSLSFRRQATATVTISVQSFDPDFGSGQKFDFVIPQSLSNENIESAQRFSVFPNPASDEVSIELTGYENQTVNVQLLDLTGRLIKTQVIDHHFDSDIHPFSLPKVAAGMYLIKVQSKDKVSMREIVIK